MIAANLLLVKPSPEIFIKSEKVKSYFNRKLRENIKCALNRAGIPFGSLEQGRGRQFLYCEEPKQAARALKKVFGIHALAPAYCFSAESMEEIKQNTIAFCRNRLEKEKIAVRASRSGEQPFSSQEIERSVGAALLQEFPGLKVNLSKPQKTINIELRKEKGICYVEETPCFGGLPPGAEGSIAMLFSGKQEELACAFLLLKRGCNIFPIGKDSKANQDTLAMLIPWNCGRAFFITPEKGLKGLIAERDILAIAVPGTGTSKKDFESYKKKDKKMPLPVLRPLLFYPCLQELLKTINALN